MVTERNTFLRKVQFGHFFSDQPIIEKRVSFPFISIWPQHWTKEINRFSAAYLYKILHFQILLIITINNSPCASACIISRLSNFTWYPVQVNVSLFSNSMLSHLIIGGKLLNWSLLNWASENRVICSEFTKQSIKQTVINDVQWSYHL